MKKIITIAIVILLVCALIAKAQSFTVVRFAVPIPEIEIPDPKPILTHQQEVWRSALEWCESRGRLESINPKDKDGTPSYYSWQFKPSTFKSLGILYGVIPKETKDAEVMELMKQYELQEKIVGYMILDKHTKWNTQFPDCVKKLGIPPIS